MIATIATIVVGAIIVLDVMIAQEFHGVRIVLSAMNVLSAMTVSAATTVVDVSIVSD